MLICAPRSSSFLIAAQFRSRTSLRNLVSAMAGNGEAKSSLSVNAVDSSKSQVDLDAAISAANNSKYGFQRYEMKKKKSLADSVKPYDRHLFLCYKDVETWPSHVETLDELPRVLADALKSRDDIQGKVRLTVCEGRDGTESSNGDILLFPDMIRYRALTHLDVDNFVEDVLVKGLTWDSRAPEALTGSHIFVCSHASRDKRCGVCGPVLVDVLNKEIELRGLKDQVFVRPCSHTGGHKYAGNLIIFSPNSEGKAAGHWYGYVTPDDVPLLLEEHIGKGKIIERLWRGQMSSPKEEGNKDGAGCCQGANGSSCCMDEKVEVKSETAGNQQSQSTLGKLAAWTGIWGEK
ncbi:hypothetical protein NE237_007514 [Protea cynaroides]|uniref:Uncharacterized protein n=1 Tax=Protea cynaroides TaxID=273540 RepID=A0A9Q0QWI6_9MAGN|nr:hypothetical protein NE237_007514 [Protea cynaroides]